jgi:hypothetical protein
MILLFLLISITGCEDNDLGFPINFGSKRDSPPSSSQQQEYKDLYLKQPVTRKPKIKPMFNNLSSYVNKMVLPPRGDGPGCNADSSIFHEGMPQVDRDIRVPQTGSSKAETLGWIQNNLVGGTYKFIKHPGPLKAADHADICKSFNRAINGKPLPTPQAGHCSSASFLGVILMLKNHRPEVLEKFKDDFTCNEKARGGWKYGKAYTLFANNYNAWVKKYLGKKNLFWIRRKDLSLNYSLGVPEVGDSVVINRKRSGHSVIFSHYEKNRVGKITKFCYWSSNSNPYGRPRGYQDGMGMRCESIGRIQSLSVGKI